MNLFNAYYDQNSKVLYATHNSGFYSCINCARISLYKLVSQGILPNSVSFINSLYMYRDQSDIDLYDILYRKDDRYLSEIKTGIDFDMFCPTLSSHEYLNLEFFKPIDKTYFAPSLKVEGQVESFIKKYNINFDNTIAVLHRGNDKWKETKLQSLNKWIDVIESKYVEGGRILIQTDEENFKNGLVEYLGDKCFIIEEMIFGNDLHNNIRPVTNKINWAINFESVMRIISRCNKIINHTGNCALVPIVYRGTLKGETQLFNEAVLCYDEKN